MFEMKKLRIIEVRLGHDKWERCHFEQLDIGDVVRMFNPDGSVVKDSEGETVWRVISCPFFGYETDRDWIQRQKEGRF